jgi:hypothetical protein
MMQPNSITAYIKGGLGNQCFIYAAARTLADQMSLPLTLDLGYLQIDSTYHRPYWLSEFNTRVNQIDDAAPGWIAGLRAVRYRLFSRCGTRLGGYYCDARPHRHWRELFENPAPGRMTLDGYWQSEKYFGANQAVLAKDFFLRDEALFADLEEAQSIRRASASAFLHVRSYKEIPSRQDGSAALPAAYFHNALRKLQSEVGICQLFVFSDDVPWARCQLQVPAGLEVKYVEPSGRGSSHDTLRDFYLMRLCKHGIVANSSFSWWAGWLGEYDWLARGERPVRIRVNRTCMNEDYWPERWLVVDC